MLQNWNPALAVSAEASPCTGQSMLSACVMTGIPYVALPVACLIAVKVVERLLASLRQRPTIAIVRVKAVVHVSIETVVAVEPWTSSNEKAAIEPVGPIVAVGRAVIGWIVEVPIGADGLNANTDADLGLPDRCSAEECNCESCER